MYASQMVPSLSKTAPPLKKSKESEPLLVACTTLLIVSCHGSLVLIHLIHYLRNKKERKRQLFRLTTKHLKSGLYFLSYQGHSLHDFNFHLQSWQLESKINACI